MSSTSNFAPAMGFRERIPRGNGSPALFARCCRHRILPASDESLAIASSAYLAEAKIRRVRAAGDVAFIEVSVPGGFFDVAFIDIGSNCRDAMPLS